MGAGPKWRLAVIVLLGVVCLASSAPERPEHTVKVHQRDRPHQRGHTRVALALHAQQGINHADVVEGDDQQESNQEELPILDSENQPEQRPETHADGEKEQWKEHRKENVPQSEESIEHPDEQNPPDDSENGAEESADSNQDSKPEEHSEDQTSSDQEDENAKTQANFKKLFDTEKEGYNGYKEPDGDSESESQGDDQGGSDTERDQSADEGHAANQSSQNGKSDSSESSDIEQHESEATEESEEQSHVKQAHKLKNKHTPLLASGNEVSLSQTADEIAKLSRQIRSGKFDISKTVTAEQKAELKAHLKAKLEFLKLDASDEMHAHILRITEHLDNPGDKEIKSDGIVLKARLRASDVFRKAPADAKYVGEPIQQLNSSVKLPKYSGARARSKRSGILDIVIHHDDVNRIDEMMEFWIRFLQIKKVRSLQPYIFIYCQNNGYNITEAHFKQMLQLGGEIVHLPAAGTEHQSYLDHIKSFYYDLADHTIFAKAISSGQFHDRIERMFEPHTGFLPLALVGHVDCYAKFPPPAMMGQIYAMFTSEFCPAHGYTSAFEGQFLVSKQRILKHNRNRYEGFIDLVTADEHHWVHEKHDHNDMKNGTNPLFGHIMERTWSMAFGCFDHWREMNCRRCIEWHEMRNCGDDSCQCFDPLPKAEPKPGIQEE